MLYQTIIIITSTFMLSACISNTELSHEGSRYEDNLAFQKAVNDPSYQNASKSYQAEDYSSAFHNLYPLAQDGMADAQAILGYMYLYGQGVNKNIPKALLWLNKAADQGVSESYSILGHIYLKGADGLEKDGQEAKKWFLKASLRGDRQAQFQLAYLYSHEQEGVAYNPNKALKWYKLSAQGGYPNSQHNLALIFLSGKGGVKKNPKEALKWFHRAAQQNYKRSQTSLAGLYFIGEVIEQNLAYAHMWAFISSKDDLQGDGVLFLQIIGDYMNDTELKLARKLAAWCLKKELRGCDDLHSFKPQRKTLL